MKVIKYSCIFLFGIFFSGVLLGDGREVTATYVESPPRMDGKLEDPIWKNGVWFTDFKLIRDSRESAKVQTEFQVAYDDEYVYIAARMDEPEPGSLKIEEFLRDGAVCRDDSFEVMLAPYGGEGRDEYFHFITNAVGIRYDARQSYGGEFHDSGWDSNWKVATKISAGQWTLEMAIPFAELSLNKKSEKPWSFNIARHRSIGDKEEFSSFSPMNGSFLIAKEFSKLHFPKADFRKFFWGIKAPFDYHIEAGKGEWILTGKVLVSNDGSPNEQFKLLFKQVNKKGAMVLDVLTDSIPIGGEKEFVFHLPVEKQEPLELQVEVVNIDDVKEVYRAKKIKLNVNYKSMMLDLISPSYRNYIYSDENIAALKINARLALAPKVLKGASLQLRLLSEKADLVVERSYDRLSNMQEITFPIGDIVPGYYVIEAQLIDKNGDIIAKTSQTLRKLRHEESEWRLSSSGALLHNGEPFLPIGWFGMLPGELQLANGAPYNSLFMSNDIITDENEAIKYLDAVAKARGYAVIYPYPTQEMIGSRQNLLRPLSSVEIQGIQQRVKRLKKHSALMAWVIADGPEFDGVLPTRIKQIYSILMKEDPFHPVIILNSSVGGVKEYLGLADISMLSTAVTFAKDGGPTRRIDSVYYYFDFANKIAGGNVTLWAELQAYGYSSNWTEPVRVPTFLELRNMFYQAVIGGVKGFFWNNYLYTYNYPEVSIGVEHMAKELELLKSAILIEEIGKKIAIQCENSNVIYSSQREVGLDQYLFVVNTGSSSQNVTFDIPEYSGLDKLYVFSENRMIPVQKGGIFKDNFEPYAAHVYVTRNLGGLPSLEDVQDAIDLANKERKKIGNLAFEDSGVTISASSSEDLNAIRGVNDGVFGGIAWMSKKTEELPQWIELSWVKPVKVAKVVIYSDTIESARVQVKKDGAWIDIADFKRRSGAHLRSSFKERELGEMRILITEKKPGVDVVTLSEVEVYNNSTNEESS